MTATNSHKKAKALKVGSRRPAKELCSECGLCDTYYIHYVKQACAFINQQIAELETSTHGRSRDLDNQDDLYFGVHQEMMSAKKKQPIEGAQGTGMVSKTTQNPAPRKTKSTPQLPSPQENEGCQEKTTHRRSSRDWNG